MTDAHLGRLLPACLHQAIADEMPQRLDFYEEWLHPDRLLDGTIGLAPISAVLGFLRTEGARYDAVMQRAGALAADWSISSLPPYQRRLGKSLPVGLRSRYALRIARRIVSSVMSTSKASTKVRKGRATVRVDASVFCAVRERAVAPLCAFYSALVVETLRAFQLPADARIESCHAVSAGSCVLTFDLHGRHEAAHAAKAAAILVAMTVGHADVRAVDPPEPTPRVLVMPFSLQHEGAKAGSAQATVWLGEAATTLLGDELTAQGFPAFAREDRVDVFDRLNVPMSSELTRATVYRIAELMGASEVVFGEVTYGPDLSVRARSIRLDTGELLPEVRETGTLADVFAISRRLARSVGQRFGRAPVSPPVTLPALPLPALENYIKGLMAATPLAQQRFLESAMTQAPQDGRVLTALWSVYTRLDVHDKALSVASAVPVSSLQYRMARWQVSLSLIELRRFDGALKELASLHASQGSAAISNAIGVAELRRAPSPAGPQRAATFFERASKEAPGDPDFLFNLGYARAMAGDHAGAVQWLREAVRHDAADGDAHLVMAVGLTALGRTAEAQREGELARLLGTSLETVPREIRALPPGLERVRNSLVEAVPRAALGVSAQRDQVETARFHLTRGRALLAEGRDRDAALELRRAVYLAPYEDEPHLLLGEVYRRAGRHAEAIDEFKVAIWCRDSAAARIALGRVLFESGERVLARAEFERALVLAPDSTEAREWLRKIGGLLAQRRVLTSFATS